MTQPPDAAATSTDRVTQYARDVAEGRIVAGPHVRDACARHLRDLAEGRARGLEWSLDLANRAIGFCEEVLHLAGGEYEGVPFLLLPWQVFVIGSLFGWLGPDGYRRFRQAYVETGKGSGKSPLAAAIGLYGMTADGEPRAEIYAAATKKDQAMVLFRDAVAMVDQSPELAARLRRSGIGEQTWNLAYLQTGSFFRPISADDGQQGPRPHIGLLDEIHEHRNGYMVETLRAGTKSRRQALIFMITNSGADRTSVCWDYHEYGAKVASGASADDSFFAYICALDAGDDPFADEACWLKVNPSLEAGLPGLKYLREQVVQARGIPSKESVVRRLNFCQWVDAAAPWIGRDVWMSCQEPPPDPALLEGRRCWGGLDLGSTQDLTGLALLFEPTDADPVWRLKTWAWLPEEGLSDKADRDRVPYLAWRAAGHLETTPGRAINKLAVARRLAEIAGAYDLQDVGFDRWRIEDLKMLMEQEGIAVRLEPVGQGFKDMSPAVDEFERRLLARDLRHDGNPVLTWCAANAVTATDPAGNRKVSKEKATGRVDLVVAALMAVSRSMTRPQVPAFVGIEVWA